MLEDKFNSFTQNDYEIIKREVLYKGFLRLARYQLRFRLFNGGFSQVVMREVTERRSAAGVLLYDPVLEYVVLIEQFRPGALANPQSPWLMEVPAGVYENGEKPVDVAKRETWEEVGCEILDIYPICEYFVSPGASNEYYSLYCGRIDASDVGGIHGMPEEGEDIQAVVLPADEAFTLLQEGKIKTSPAIISLQWLQLNREWLRQLWQTK
jgi:ADP-ribose pyrophosphatase